MTKDQKLVKAISKYQSGWVAIDKDQEIVEHTSDFKSIAEKTKNRRGLTLIPASRNFFGFVT